MEDSGTGLQQGKKKSLSKKSRIKLSSDHILRLEYFGGLLYNRVTHNLFALNKKAADILFLTQYSLSIEEVAEALGNEINEGGDTVNSIIEFLNPLYVIGVVEESKKNGDLNRALSMLRRATCLVSDLSYLSAPIQAYLHLTWNCGMRCKFCFVNAPRKLVRNQLNLGKETAAILSLSKYARNYNPHVMNEVMSLGKVPQRILSILVKDRGVASCPFLG
ncbi:MAG: hypothetical protein FGF48_03785 [Candidatus Brockarchaeota archaeon]|nr:hypothetical protein [Candidatus Brockarchaeota archaeon]